MSIRHFCRQNQLGQPVYAELVAGAWQSFTGYPWERPPSASSTASPESPAALPPATYLLPVEPSKIVGIGKNYRAHAAELGGPLPAEPLLFLKAPSALLDPGDRVELPQLSERVDFEGELAVIIGKRTRKVSEAEALEAIFGYTVACDLTARDLQKTDGQWARAKSFDGFCPLSNVITTGIDLSRAELTTHVNGVLRQSSPLSDMVFGLARIISHVSAAMTLLPGDVILTGTPEGVGPLAAGDHVRVAISGLVPLEFDVAS